MSEEIKKMIVSLPQREEFGESYPSGTSASILENGLDMPIPIPIAVENNTTAPADSGMTIIPLESAVIIAVTEAEAEK